MDKSREIVKTIGQIWAQRLQWLGRSLLLLMLAGLLAWGVGENNASAAPVLCRQRGDHEVCILRIKRSAKNYWEYRAAVKIDGQKRPVEIYNCRDRTHTTKTGKVMPFDPNGAGPLICQLLYR